ncbi:hypothetical protein EZV62_005019 [Acer yangbiense]|uniref:Ubiquitin-like protease family profile domain-containing protein n=1 Tax=Acer yangbiense TaxID=1000413 RepID=A0A5C7IMM6_9ROSI|nr:hypothetical protein EZV62_005019 [Acer yangbiense]
MDPLLPTHEEDEEGLSEVDPCSIGNRNSRGSTKLRWLKRNHWMLVIMDPHDFMVYFLDSHSNKPCQNLKNFTSLAFTMFVDKIGKKDSKCITWRMIKCPQQPTGVECGYYMMRYMKDIVANHQNVLIMEKFNRRNTYSQAEIDDRSQIRVGRICWKVLLDIIYFLYEFADSVECPRQLCFSN